MVDKIIQGLFEKAGFVEEKEIENGKCANCGSGLDSSDFMTADDGRKVCESCYYEADAIATVYLNGDEKNPEIITDFHNGTDFVISYHQTDGWRGYYEVTGSKGWVNVHDDNILGYSEDMEDLKEFDKKLKDFCKDRGIKFAVVVCLSSNVFSSGYDFFVKQGSEKDIMEFIQNLKSNGMRDPVKYQTEALTGVPASQQTKEDKDAALAMGLVKAGSSPEQAIRTVKAIEAMDTLLSKKKPKTTQKKGKRGKR